MDVVIYKSKKQLHSIRGRWISMRTNKKVIGGNASYRPEDLRYLLELASLDDLFNFFDKDWETYISGQRKKFSGN